MSKNILRYAVGGVVGIILTFVASEDVTAAISTAEKDAEEKADTDGLKKRANEEAEYIVKGILERSVGDKELVVVRANEL